MQRRRGTRQASSAEEEEARQARIHQAKVAERAQGPEEAKPWPTRNCDLDDRPFVSEVAIFVNWQLVLSESAESLTHIRRDTPQQRSMAAGLAAFLQMVAHPLGGKVEAVSTMEGHVEGRWHYNMSTGEGYERRAKVNIDVIALPVDAAFKVDQNNIAGVIIRAMAVDWDFSFSEALKWTVIGNARLASHGAPRSNIGPNGMARQTTRKLYEQMTHAATIDMFPETLIHDVMLRPERYFPYMCKWLDESRAKDIQNLERTLLLREARKKKLQDERERKRAAAAAGGGGGGGDAAADNMEADPEDEADDAAVDLDPEVHERVRKEAVHQVSTDMRLPYNLLASLLHMNTHNRTQRNQCAESLISSSLHVHNSSILARFEVNDPVTLSQQLDALSYGVKTLDRFVSWAGASFCSDHERVKEANDEARKLDDGGIMHVDLRKTKLAPEEMFTLANALNQAREAGAAASLCYLEDYYGVRGSAGGELGRPFEPERVFDTVTFAPLGHVPRWERSEQEIRELSDNVEQNEVTMAPYYGRIPDPQNTRPLSVKDAPFESLRHLRFWFTEDDIAEDIDKRLKAALMSNTASGKMVRSLAEHFTGIAKSAKLRDGDDDDNNNNNNENENAECLFVDSNRSVRSSEHRRLTAMDTVGYNVGRTLDSEMARCQRECFSAAQTRLDEAFRIPGLVQYSVEYTDNDIGVNSHYKSNFTIAADRLRPLARKMEELERLDYESYADLMPRFRNHCARVFSRIYVTGSFNNGSAMISVRKYERENWADPTRVCGSGAYQRVRPISAALSHFGNRMAGDIIALTAVMDVSFCHPVMWNMLTATRAVAFVGGVVKGHQINHSKAGDGKSHMVDQVLGLSIEQTYVKSMVTSTMAHVDAMASDDQLIVMDEAPKLFQEPNKMSDKDEHTQNNVFRGIMSSGEISVARSVKGQYTNTFTADHRVTILMNANKMDAPLGFEFSLITRLRVVRPADNVGQGRSIYDMHNVSSKANSTRRPVMERLWRGTQALQAIMGKMINLYALPKPDTMVVSCMLQYMTRRIDMYYPRWMDAMRGSKRVADTVLGFAMFNAQALVFNSDLSPFSPEHSNMMTNPGFDVMQMRRCSPFMFGTTEMMVSAMLQVFEQTSATELHAMMYALATTKGFARSDYAHLFVHGGRDFVGVASDSSAEFTEKQDAEASVDDITCKLWLFTRSLKSLGKPALEHRLRRAVGIKSATDPVTRQCYRVNDRGERIIDEIVCGAEFERRSLEWYDSLTEDMHARIEKRIVHPSKVDVRYKRGGWMPSDWDRSADDMPEFWTVYETMLDAVEQRNSSTEKKDARHVTFAQRDGRDAGYDPNYVVFTFSDTNRDGATAVEQALGSYAISRVNWAYIYNHFIKDRKAMMMRMPQLETAASNLASDVRWARDSKDNIVTRVVPVVIPGKGGRSLSINLPWLMLGGWHNHMMDMLTSLEDAFVPARGKTLTLLQSRSRAPWLMESITLRRRQNHVIRVSNPAYVASTADNAVIAALPVPEAEEAIYKMLNAKHNDSSAASALAFRAANATITAVEHSMRSESATGKAVSIDTVNQLRMKRYHEVCNRLKRQHADLTDMLKADGERPHPLQLPPLPAMLTADSQEAAKGNPDAFIAPDKKEITFDMASVDDTLHKLFLYRTGQKIGAPWSKIESTLADDVKMVFSAVSEMHKVAAEEANRMAESTHIKAHDYTLETPAVDMKDADYDSDGEYGADEMENDTMPAEGQSQVEYRAMSHQEQRKYRDEMISATRILGDYVDKERETVNAFPGRYLPEERPQWMHRNESDAAQLRGKAQSSLTAVVECTTQKQIPRAPEITMVIKACYATQWTHPSLELAWQKKTIDASSLASSRLMIAAGGGGGDDDDATATGNHLVPLSPTNDDDKNKAGKRQNQLVVDTMAGRIESKARHHHRPGGYESSDDDDDDDDDDNDSNDSNGIVGDTNGDNFRYHLPDHDSQMDTSTSSGVSTSSSDHTVDLIDYGQLQDDQWN